MAAGIPIGSLLAGRWIVGTPLGAGESGEVYEAEEAQGGRLCAVKILFPELSRIGAAWSAFQQEVRNVSSLTADGIARVYDLGIDSKLHRAFVACERVMFPSLSRYVSERGPLSPAALAQALTTLARAVDAMHAAGIVHGGLRPQNVFISPENPTWARVTDYGVVRLKLALSPRTATTLGWSAPEVVSAQHLLPSADLYGLALVAFFALTGMPWVTAFGAQNTDNPMSAPSVPASVRARELGGSIDPAFDQWFKATLAGDPASRYTNAKELAEAFAAIAQASAPRVAAASPGVVSAVARPLVFRRDLPHSPVPNQTMSGIGGGFEPVPSRRALGVESAAAAGLPYSATVPEMPALHPQAAHPGHFDAHDQPPMSATLPVGAMFAGGIPGLPPPPQAPVNAQQQAYAQQPGYAPAAYDASGGYDASGAYNASNPYAGQANYTPNPGGYGQPAAFAYPAGGGQELSVPAPAYASPKRVVLLIAVIGGLLVLALVAGAVTLMSKRSGTSASASASVASPVESVAASETVSPPAAEPPAVPTTEPPTAPATAAPAPAPTPAPAPIAVAKPATATPFKPVSTASKPAVTSKPATTPKPTTTASKPATKPSSKKCGTFINPCK